MINNQVQSPATGKNSAISSQASIEEKGEAGKQKGGLFKLLMNSVHSETTNGKSGKDSAANILGGNLTLNTNQEGDGGKQSAIHLLAGSNEGGKEEKITLSRLLDGSGSGADETTDAAENGSEASAETVTMGSEDNSEGEKTADDGESEKESRESTNTESTDIESAGMTTGGDAQKIEAETVGESNPGGETRTIDDGANSDQTTAAGQAAALTGEASVNQAASQNEAGKSAKNSNPLNGLIAGQEQTAKGKQIGGNDIVTGEKIVSNNGLTERREGGEIGTNIRESLGSVKSEGLVNELRALAAAQGEQLATGKQERLTPDHLDGAAPAEDAAIIKEIFSALQSGSIEQIAAEIRSLRASQIRESKYSNHLASSANRQDMTNAGSSLSAGSGSSTSAQAGSVSTMMPVTAMVPGGASVSSEMFDENASALWKEQITEYFESKDKSSAENQAAAAFARLGDVPVTNISVRRSFAQGISKAIISTAGQGSKGSDVWQKHNFVLDDGKNIQLAAREVDGVLQLKLSSSASELNKLLMEHEKEIRELLENELELTIDLQMDGGGDSNVADFFGGSTGHQPSGKDGNNPIDLGSMRRTEEQKVEKVVPQAVRKFGYNQNEWTV